MATKTIITCDFCGAQQPEVKSWERDFRSITIITETACTNPMSKHATGFQSNRAHYEHLCYDCQRKAAQALCDLVDSLKSNAKDQASD